MKKKLISAALVLVVLLAVAAPDSHAAASTASSVNDRSVCYTPAGDYKSGDCILTATKVMIRRALIMLGSGEWSSISNKTLRKSVTIWGLLLHRFSFEADGLSFKVRVGFFSGSTEEQRLKEFERLIKAHPEGVVVWGKSSSIFGMHGVLLTDVKNGVPYVMDSYYNTGIRRYGILKWIDSSMLSPTRCTQYWIIKEVGLAKKAKAPAKGKPLAPASVKKPSTKSTMAIRDNTVPSQVQEGNGFGVEGVISSNYRLSEVKAQIINSAGRVAIGQTVKPGTWNYDLIKIDSKIKFGTLAPGTYRYKITAADEKQTKVLVNAEFKVLPKPKSTLKVSEAVLPSKVYKGDGFSIGGKISSNCRISKVTVSIIDTSGNTKQKASAYPFWKSFKISKVDAKVKFGGLDVGTYTYRVTATDSLQTKTLVNKSFKVVKRPISMLSISSYNYPESLLKGEPYSIKGLINSDKPIKKVSVKVTDLSGRSILSASANMYTRYYNVHNLDLKIRFGKLDKGTYTYSVIAKDTSQKRTLVSRKFTVK